MKLAVGVLSAGAMWLCAAGPALAQLTPDDLTDAQIAEVYCVYDYLAGHGDNAAMTDVYMTGDPDAADYKKQFVAVGQGAESCKSKYGWSDDMKDLAYMLGMYAKMGDVLDERLRAKGLTDKQIEALLAASEKLTDADLKSFVDHTWITNSDLHQRLKAALVSQGIDGAEVLTDAFYRMQAYVVTSVLVTSWISELPKG